MHKWHAQDLEPDELLVVLQYLSRELHTSMFQIITQECRWGDANDLSRVLALAASQ
jgi:hypothetical protein